MIDIYRNKSTPFFLNYDTGERYKGAATCLIDRHKRIFHRLTVKGA